MSPAIELRPVIPPAPYVLGDAKFVTTLTDVETRVATLAVKDAASAQAAADLQIRLTGAGRALEDARTALLRPLLDAQKLINDTAKPVASRIETAKQRIKTALTAFDTEQRRLAEEVERARKAELARLESIRQAEEAEAKRKAEAIAAAAAKAEADRLAKEAQLKAEPQLALASIKERIASIKARLAEAEKRTPSTFVGQSAKDAAIEQAEKELAEAAVEYAKASLELQAMQDRAAKEAEMDFAEDDPPLLPPEPAQKTATELAIEQVRLAPKAIVAAPAGITYRTTLRIAKIDVMKLPEVFIERRAKEGAIRSTFCVGWKEGQPIPECAGVAFEIERTPVSTGRDAL